MSDGIQEALENVREIRATNQEERYLNGLNQKIDEHERVTIQGELGTGLFVNAASVIMRLGVATTILVGANLILSGSIDFMLLFLFLLVITRVYAPFDQSLALIAEMFVSQVSADRMNEIYDTPTAEGAEKFEPKGHDIVFEHVGFAYDEKEVLHDVCLLYTSRQSLPVWKRCVEEWRSNGKKTVKSRHRRNRKNRIWNCKALAVFIVKMSGVFLVP